jgi:hypothetical protein
MNSDPMTGLLILLFALAMLVHYMDGVRKMGFTAGLFAFIATVLLCIIVWPLGIVVILATACYGLAKPSHA